MAHIVNTLPRLAGRSCVSAFSRQLSSATAYKPNIAIAGVTGAVGQELLRLLDERNFPVGDLKLLASQRSAGKQYQFKGETLTVEELTEDSFHGVDIALFSAGGGQSRQFAPAAVESGCVVVDNSSAFRRDPNIPLVIPEVNGHAIAQHKGIIANPNCSTIIMNMVVWPLHQVSPVERVVVSTYQAASGAGAAAMRELEQQAVDWHNGDPYTQDIFQKQYAWNLFSHNSSVDPLTGYNEEEVKMMIETKKIFEDDTIGVSATCVRVPVLRAHTEAINVTFRGQMDDNTARHILSEAPGVQVVDDRETNTFPEPIHASGEDDCFVGRIRADKSQRDGKGLEMFVSGDQLLKGAALNAVQIAEVVAQEEMYLSKPEIEAVAA